MKIKRLGRTGLKVSEVCLGTMTFGNQCDEPTSRAIMDKAFDYGVTFFDTADAYPLDSTLESMGRTEEFIGNWLKGRREQIVLATKFFFPMLKHLLMRRSGRWMTWFIAAKYAISAAPTIPPGC